MRWLSQAALALLIACALGTGALAQNAATHRVRILYEKPWVPSHEVVMRRLSERRVLELLRDFLSPLKLPRPLTVKTASCGRENASYDPRTQTITLCYELIVWIHAMIPPETERQGITHGDAVVGSVIDVILHEIAHAIFHLLELPILGNEEFAADQLAALILLQFGEDVARLTVTGTALLFQRDAQLRREARIKLAQDNGADPAVTDSRNTEFSSVHGLPEQRYYTLLCIAYGRHRKTFARFVDDGKLPVHRARFCQSEYEQIAFAYRKLIEPHIDPVLRNQVLKRDWISAIRSKN